MKQWAVQWKKKLKSSCVDHVDGNKSLWNRSGSEDVRGPSVWSCGHVSQTTAVEVIRSQDALRTLMGAFRPVLSADHFWSDHSGLTLIPGLNGGFDLWPLTHISQSINRSDFINNALFTQTKSTTKCKQAQPHHSRTYQWGNTRGRVFKKTWI